MDYTLIFLTGVFASLHCIGMCGAIVLAYSMQHKTNAAESNTPLWIRTLPLHLAYNGGRIISYTLLGIIVGFIGSFFTPIKDAARYVSLISGILMIVAGILMLKIIPMPASRAWDGLSRFSTKTFGKVIQASSVSSKLLLGILTPLFPCGILYAMLIKAAATQNFVEGGITMLLFAAGMTPALTAVGAASFFLSSKVRNIGDKLAAVTIILMGIILLLRGLGIPFLAFLGGDHGSCCH